MIIYGVSWPDDTPQITVELFFVKNNGYYTNKSGVKCGEGLFHHFKEAMKLLWPKDDHHRWTDLIIKTFCEGEISVLLGCSDSCKTWTISKLVLVDYWSDPDRTLWLVSTTEGRGSELRIWGAIKTLFNLGRRLFPDLKGNPIDYLKTITTESVDEEGREARSLRQGIIVIPCKTGGLVSGLAPYIGIKAPRLRHAGDEVQAMNEAFLNAYSNWYGKEDFKGVMAGNFMETDDPLGRASEPEAGWDAWQDTGKTQSWKSRFYGANVIALDGRDSPNFDFPLINGKPKYTYLIGQKKLDGTKTTHGTDSWQWYSQCVGKPVRGMDIWRVLNKDFCTKHGASEDVVWKSNPIKLYSLDPAYGGGDLCIGRYYEMGEDMRGKQTLFCHIPETIPIKVKIKDTDPEPEEQIAQYVFNRLKTLEIEAINCGYDSFGRGTLGNEFAKLFGSKCPIPVDSSAQCTTRPVRFDLYVTEKDGKKRHKRCDEHYKKFITEMYFSCREAIDCEQIRGLDADSIREGSSRKFEKNRDSKLELEPKDLYKERFSGRSPDKMDNFAVGVEIARQRGFKIENLAAKVEQKKGPDWLDQQMKGYAELLKSKELTAIK